MKIDTSPPTSHGSPTFSSPKKYRKSTTNKKVKHNDESESDDSLDKNVAFHPKINKQSP